MGKSLKTRSFRKSLGEANRGILYSLRTQKHLRFHIFSASIVLFMAWWCHLSRPEVVLLILTIGSVIAAEIFNTAIEVVVDLAEPTFHPLAGLAKDVAAGAVLVTAIQSVVIGILIFGPVLMEGIK